jgi:hypothetical protein
MTQEEKFAKRREAGKIYQYKPNPFPKGSDEYYEEQVKRAEKNAFKTLGFAKLRSIYAKLDFQIAKKEKESKEKSKKNNKAVKKG